MSGGTFRLARRSLASRENARLTPAGIRSPRAKLELRRMGGQSNIRRTEYDRDGGETIYETHRWSYNKAAKVWATLLEGQRV
ncbi:hypothetical protein Misp02_70550 [Microtetraspora sp. NBRC 16547]|nr:hypothetical protein Misp02_70550 [Microtetraspora sp. NBRC 16547]